jgi:hypothetical protein
MSTNHELQSLLDLISETLQTLPDNARGIAANLIRRRIDELYPKPIAKCVDVVEKMTPAEQHAFGITELGYGKYLDIQIRDIPREYLEWLADAKRKEWRELHSYLLSLGVNDIHG